MNDVIIMYILYVATILSCLFNCALSFYFSTCDTLCNYANKLFYVSFVFSIVLVVCDVLFMFYI